MKVLAAAGADAKIPAADGTTPLMVAAGPGDVVRRRRRRLAAGPGRRSGRGREDVRRARQRRQCPQQRGRDAAARRRVPRRERNRRVPGGEGRRLDARDSRGWTPFTIANGISYGDVFKQQPQTAELLEQLMTARGLSTEGQAADGTECLDCIQTHADQARAALERDGGWKPSSRNQRPSAFPHVDSRTKSSNTDTTDTNGHDGIPNRTCPYVSVLRPARPASPAAARNESHGIHKPSLQFRMACEVPCDSFRAPLRGADRSRVLRFSSFRLPCVIFGASRCALSGEILFVPNNLALGLGCQSHHVSDREVDHGPNASEGGARDGDARRAGRWPPAITNVPDPVGLAGLRRDQRWFESTRRSIRSTRTR